MSISPPPVRLPPPTGEPAGTYSRLVLIGGGPASASVLIRLADRIGTGPAPVDITVVDRSGEIGGGDPHGLTTSPALLLNDKVEHIDGTGIGFTAWLRAERPRWIARLVDAADPRATRWLDRNRDALARTDFGGLYLPRCVFGDFIRERVDRAVRQLRAAGARWRIVTGEVVTVRPHSPGGYQVLLRDDPVPLPADAVVLAVGSLDPRVPADLAEHRCYYSYRRARDVSALEEGLATLLAARPEDHRRVAVLGSSAAASEVIAVVEGSTVLAPLVDEVVVISPDARLAEGLTSGILTPFACAHLPGLVARWQAGAAPASDQLVDAVCRDVAAGRARGYTIVDLLPVLGPEFDRGFALLPGAEKRLFVERDFARYRKVIRHTAPEYAAAAARLAASGRLTLFAGQVTRVASARAGRLYVRVGHGDRVSALSVSAVFDCRGFTGVLSTDNPVVADVVATGLARANPSGRGLAVDADLAAAAGLYVLGPALAGTSQGTDHIWSMENIPRIHTLAERVADNLWRHLVDRPTHPIAKGSV